MDCQDWTTVTVRRNISKKDQIKKGYTTIQSRDPEKNEKIRMAKLADADGPAPVKRINSESLQDLIRKRIELKLSQEKADIMCAFPKNTFKEIEARRLIPNEEQKRKIQQNFGIQLKINTITA
jgi:ribosome-binding protein aMBF1 (putative translation factor)